jgi:hypothetical protein
MKSNFFLLTATAIVLGFSSCKNEQEEQAQKKPDTYTTYVDSLCNVAGADVKENWEAVAMCSEEQLPEAKAALANLKDKTAGKEKVIAAEAKYAEWKTKVETDIAMADPKVKLSNSLFGEGKMGNDMQFSWVNRDNIHETYQNFIHTVENNKDNYSREDWDEIKVLYEALDNRKNVVENEGLSTADNFKIAGLKVKFAPMLAINRAGDKAKENSDAKK